jgi:hypothetical protein
MLDWPMISLNSGDFITRESSGDGSSWKGWKHSFELSFFILDTYW